VLDAAAGEKAARFVRTCDAFGIPLIVIADVQGFLPGAGQEWEGAVRRGAKLLHAFGESVVPRVTLITRRAYGGAYVAMNSKSLGATRVFAWPQAEVSVMGAVAAVRVLHRRLLADIPAEQREFMELELAAEHEKVSGGVLKAIEIGAVDEMVSPAQTRSALAKTIANAPHRRGTHGNIPL
jgi:acetyl-CoA/propionyl-CoA carboxylase carboxyl transferase subunit